MEEQLKAAIAGLDNSPGANRQRYDMFDWVHRTGITNAHLERNLVHANNIIAAENLSLA